MRGRSVGSRLGRAAWPAAWVAAAVAGAGWANGAAQGPPLEVAAPAVSGVALVGQTLSATAGRWSGAAPIAFQYQWQDCAAATAACVPIAGATAQSYLLGAGDAGQTVRVQVTATNAAGSATSLSSPTTAIAASAPAGATPLPGGGVSLPASSVQAPDRLRLVSVRIVPARPQAGASFRVRVQVGDAAGYAIQGAAVTVAVLPYGLFEPAAGTVTDVQGLGVATMLPAPLASLQPGLTPALVVTATVPGTTAPANVSASSLLQLRLAPRGAGTAAASPYGAGMRGYDLSYPDCARPRPPQAGFAILGVNGGRPFTFNRCLLREHGWYAGTGPQAVYLNTGYESSYARQVTPACALAVGSLRGSAAQAYAIGCSEAATSLERIMLLGIPPPEVWWLDVEPSNSWSSSRALNTGVLRGMVDFLGRLTPAPVVGVYSQPSWWRQITGGWATPLPEWVPSRGGACPSGFSAGPVWLAQSGGATLDVDTAC